MTRSLRNQEYKDTKPLTVKELHDIKRKFYAKKKKGKKFGSTYLELNEARAIKNAQDNLRKAAQERSLLFRRASSVMLDTRGIKKTHTPFADLKDLLSTSQPVSQPPDTTPNC